MKLRFYAIMSFCIFTTTHSGLATSMPHQKHPPSCDPILTVGFVIDGLAYHVLQKVRPYLTGGIARLLNQGAVYENAYYPHGLTTTGPGHATISTGTTPSNHGIVSNSWINDEGQKVRCDDDTSPEGIIITSEGPSPECTGKSPHNLEADTLSDQFHASSRPHEPHQVYALSLKSRAAIMLAGKGGKAIWYDKNKHQFVSSATYFELLPEWLNVFNQSTQAYDKLLRTRPWRLVYPHDHQAYKFNALDTYVYSGYKSLIHNTHELLNAHEDKDGLIMYLPELQAELLELGRVTLNNILNPNSNNKTMLWLALSSLDKIGHDYGPDSREYIDMIYHLDLQIGEFMKYVESLVPKNKILYFFTADHGQSSIPEIAHEYGNKFPIRVSTVDMRNNLNAILEKKYNTPKIIKKIKLPYCYLHIPTLSTFSKNKQQHILKDVQKLLAKDPNILSVWRPEELSCSHDLNIKSTWFARHHYPRRGGQLMILPKPGRQLTKKITGTHHQEPYESNAHVPLILMGCGIAPRQIYKRVWIPQLAPTVAQILGVNRPSASLFKPLPGTQSLTKPHTFK